MTNLPTEQITLHILFANVPMDVVGSFQQMPLEALTGVAGDAELRALTVHSISIGGHNVTHIISALLEGNEPALEKFTELCNAAAERLANKTAPVHVAGVPTCQ